MSEQTIIILVFLFSLIIGIGYAFIAVAHPPNDSGPVWRKTWAYVGYGNALIIASFGIIEYVMTKQLFWTWYWIALNGVWGGCQVIGQTFKHNIEAMNTRKTGSKLDELLRQAASGLGDDI